MKSVITQWRTQSNTYEHLCRYFHRQGDKKFALYYLDLLVKKQLDVYRWEKENGETENALTTRKNTLGVVRRFKGIRTYFYVRKRFRNETKQINS